MLRKGKLFIGTSGYSYQHWQGRFYPTELSQRKWLEFYTQHFNTVELNVTFYRLPKSAVFKSWYLRTPKNFSFSIKGSRFISHVKRLKNVKDPLGLFFNRASFLSEKLDCVLWQLAPGFSLNLERLEEFLKNLKGYKKRSAFEFRHISWFVPDVFSLLKKYNCALCLADYPEFAVEKPTDLCEFVYMRRHGRDSLYASSYEDAELQDDARIIKKFLKRGQDVYIYFNNDAQAHAVFNALTLRKMSGFKKLNENKNK